MVVVEVVIVVVLMISSKCHYCRRRCINEGLAYDRCREVTSQTAASGRATSTNLFCLATFPS